MDKGTRFACVRALLRVLATTLAALFATSAGAYPAFGNDLVYASGFEKAAASSGGSNYHWYRVSACDREPFGLVASYHKTIPGTGGSVRTLAKQQLQTMIAAGQQRLSLGIYFFHGDVGDNGTLVDSSNPAAVAQAVLNVQALLADAKAAGFKEILFRFFPVGSISPSHGGYVYGSAIVAEYWNLVTKVRPVLVAAGLSYRIDLMVEGAPRDSGTPLPEPWKYPANTHWSYAVRDLWQRYFAAYGREDTVGFSFLTDADPTRLRQRVRHMRFVYEGNYPHLFAADLYGTASVSEADKFIALHDAMVREDANGALGWRNAGWIIAESFYDDPLAAAGLASAIASTRRTVFYLTQWPWDRADLSCGPQPEVNVAPPTAWTTYRGYGF